MSQIHTLSTHLLDVALGVAAPDVPAVLERIESDGSSTIVGHGTTDAGGLIRDLNDGPLPAGDYRLTLQTADYFAEVHGTVFYPAIVVQVRLDGTRPGCHLPVLAGTYSYSTHLAG